MPTLEKDKSEEQLLEEFSRKGLSLRLKTLDASKPITLDFLTNPDKEWILRKKMSV